MFVNTKKFSLALGLLLMSLQCGFSQDAVREKKVLQKKMQEPAVLVWKSLKLMLRTGYSFDSLKSAQLFNTVDSIGLAAPLMAYSGDLLVRMRKDSLGDLNRPMWSAPVVLQSCERLRKPLLALEEDKYPLLFRRLMAATDRDSLYRLMSALQAPSEADFEHLTLALASIKLARIPDLIALYELGEIRWNKLEMNAFRFHSTFLYAQFLARKGMPFLALEKLNQLEKDLETKPFKSAEAAVNLNELKRQLLYLSLLRAQIGRQINQPEVQKQVLADWTRALKYLRYDLSQQTLVRLGAASAFLEAGKTRQAAKVLKQHKPSAPRLSPDELLMQQVIALLKEKKKAEAGKLLNESARFQFETLAFWDTWMQKQIDPELWFHRKLAKGSQYPLYRIYHQLFAVKWQ